MSKRDLKKYLSGLSKEQLEEQLVELYEKFSGVKTYYDFAFNPKEGKLSDEAKLKISNEYFPVKGKKPKMRRSIAQKYIKHFITLGVDAYVIADVMLYNIEMAQTFSSEKTIKQEIFFKSMLTSYQQAVNFIVENGIFNDFKGRIQAIAQETMTQKWYNQLAFTTVFERLAY